MAVSFDEFCATRGRAMLSFAYALTGDFHTAEDLLQTALMKCYGRWGRIDAPEAYVRRVMCRTHVRWPRHRARETPLSDNDIAAPQPTGVSEAVTDVMSFLAQLPPRQRAVVTLRYLADLPEAQVAQILEISRGTVKSQASRAVAKLRQQLEDGRPEGSKRS